MAGVCVGAQVFLFGAGIVMPIALNGAWIAALAALPMAALIVLLCRRALIRRLHAGENGRMRGVFLCLLLALTFAANAVFAAASLVNLAEQSLLPQARVTWSAAMTLGALLLCALSGGTGTARLCFALRWALPAALAVLALASVPARTLVGLFPLLGAGRFPLGIAAGCMLGAASPALLLMLPPPELEEAGGEALSCPLPGAGFFVWRVLAGALCGAGLVFALCVSTTYESIAALSAWGERLQLLGSGQPGIPQTLLTLCKMIAILLLASGMLCACAQALHAVPVMRRWRLDLLAPLALIAAALGAMIVYGFAAALLAAPFLIVPTAAALLLSLKTGGAKKKNE